MAKQNRGLKRIVHRVLEELEATRQIAEVTSVSGALATFGAKLEIQIMNRNGYRETEAAKRRLLKKHEVMLTYFEKQFSAFLQEYDFDRPLQDCEPHLRNRIWMCWWQGMENAPEIVKVCMASVQRNAGDHTVTIITEDNYREYVNIPEWIEEKYRKGIISRTHFSDLLRFFLLAEYGGIWLDASIYCADVCFADILKLPIWTIKRPEYSHISVASGYFATYAFGCQYAYRWAFATVRDFLLNYWKENDLLIDYLMLDYLIALALKKDHRMAAVFQNLLPNNPECDELFKLLNKPFDENTWETLCRQTGIFKLTWKQSFPEQVGGQSTFYAKLKEWECANNTIGTESSLWKANLR